MMEEFKVGTCLEMCPPHETKLRSKHNMLNDLEKLDGEIVTVKCFSRSAAGNQEISEEDLRPSHICQQTLTHLIENILFNRNVDATAAALTPNVYSFVFDRLRALRQDLIIQGIRNAVTQEILEQSVRFHLISGNVLANETQVIKFDAVINYNHLIECLKSLLNLYNELDVEIEERIEMTRVYLLIQLGTQAPLRWILRQDPRLRRHPKITRCIRLNTYYLERNYVKLFRELKRYNPWEILPLHWSLTPIYKDLFGIMASGFSSAQCKYPLNKFSQLFCLSYDEIDEMTHLTGVGMITEGDHHYLQFNKKNFKGQFKVERKQWSFIVKKIQNVPIKTLMME